MTREEKRDQKVLDLLNKYYVKAKFGHPGLASYNIVQYKKIKKSIEYFGIQYDEKVTKEINKWDTFVYEEFPKILEAKYSFLHWDN